MDAMAIDRLERLQASCHEKMCRIEILQAVVRENQHKIESDVPFHGLSFCVKTLKLKVAQMELLHGK